eukprot:2912446-Alexandrium_andersonii.AAC.1
MPDQKEVARASSSSGSAVRPSGPLKKVRPAGVGARKALSMFRNPSALSPKACERSFLRCAACDAA